MAEDDTTEQSPEKDPRGEDSGRDEGYLSGIVRYGRDLVGAIAGRMLGQGADEEGGGETSGADEDMEASEEGAEKGWSLRFFVLFGLGGLMAFCAVFGTVFVLQGELFSGEEDPLSGPIAPETEELPTRELLEMAREAVESGERERAEELYRGIWKRKDPQADGTLIAGLRLSMLMHERDADGVRDLVDEVVKGARPGSMLWRDAVIGRVRTLMSDGEWEQVYRNARLLQTHLQCMEGAEKLEEWVEYILVMSNMRKAVDLEENNEVPSEAVAHLGGADPDVAPATIDSPEESETEELQELKVVAEGEGHLVRGGNVDLKQFLRDLSDDISDETTIAVPGEKDAAISVCMEGEIEDIVRAVLESRGLELRRRDDGAVELREARVQSDDREVIVEDTLTDLQRFVTLYGDSHLLAEAYFAMSFLHLMAGEETGALEQLEIVFERFPNSSWQRPAHYLAGWIRCRDGEWEKARSQMGLATHARGELGHYATAYLGHILAETERWSEGADTLEEALEGEIPDYVRAMCLYDRARCLEGSGADEDRVLEGYRRAYNHNRAGRYGVKAMRSLARLHLQNGAVGKAEKCLMAGLDGDSDMSGWEEVAAGIIEAHSENGGAIRAAVRGEILWNMMEEKESARVLEALLGACAEADLAETGLRVISDLRFDELAEDVRETAQLEKARLLLQMERWDEAGEAIREAKELFGGSEKSRSWYEARLFEARLRAENGDMDEAIRISREILEANTPRELDIGALRLVGTCEVEQGNYREAASAYAGRFRLSAKSEEQR